MFQHVPCKGHPELVLSMCESCRTLVAASTHPHILALVELFHECVSWPPKKKGPQNTESCDDPKERRRAEIIRTVIFVPI
jgi:hypothetical protein